MRAMVFTLQLLLTLCAVAMLGNGLLNTVRIRRDWRHARAQRLPAPAPRISVCIPARNEARNIAACVRSLARQRYPDFEVLVLDDCSEDGTGDLAREAARGLDHVRVLAGEPLPTGWIGKPHACAQMAREANGEWLLFTDADTVWAPEALAWAVRLAQGRRADLLSGLVRLPALTLWERLSVPMLPLAGMGLFNFTLAERLPGPWYAAASGAFLFFRREAYAAIGGHETVRGQIVEDLELSRALKRAGRRLIMTDVTRLASCRMYTNLTEVWEGLTKNFYVSFPAALCPVAIAGMLGLYAFPWLSFLFGPALGWGAATAGLGLIQILAIALLRALTDRRTGYLRLGDLLLTPLGGLFLATIALRSASRHLLRQPTPWRARHYELWKHGRPQPQPRQDGSPE